MLGFDVSHFQNEIDWAQVCESAKFAFVYIKATEGIDALDSQFAVNWRSAGEGGLLRGAYHFFEPQDDPVAQANFFLGTVGPLAPGDLPPALDVEISRGVDGQAVLEGVQTWLDTVEKATGRRPLIYTGYKFWNSLGSAAFGSYPLWLAEYGTDDPILPAGWQHWTFWQFDDEALVPGIETPVDLDRFAGSLRDLVKLAGLP